MQGFSLSSASIGAANPCAVFAQSSNSLPLRPPKTGPIVRAELDEKKYPKALKVSDAQLATMNIFPHDFHGE